MKTLGIIVAIAAISPAALDTFNLDKVTTINHVIITKETKQTSSAFQIVHDFLEFLLMRCKSKVGTNKLYSNQMFYLSLDNFTPSVLLKEVSEILFLILVSFLLSAIKNYKLLSHAHCFSLSLSDSSPVVPRISLPVSHCI
jgi:hypothetical protein